MTFHHWVHQRTTFVAELIVAEVVVAQLSHEMEVDDEGLDQAVEWFFAIALF